MIELQGRYHDTIIIIPEGHPYQNGNDMAAILLTYPPMYCPNRTSCHLVPKYTTARWLWHWYSLYKALQKFPQFSWIYWWLRRSYLESGWRLLCFYLNGSKYSSLTSALISGSTTALCYTPAFLSTSFKPIHTFRLISLNWNKAF